ncbi:MULTISPECIES: exodeoxyribonuclease VII small subunit [Haloarcula]|jgi:exodeoxyribonuclease VII small subunit|uniref:Exodeoxyribonuclease VII small subunit n=2 Tax=Haloarcula TaxID=2237 RepID=A0A847UF11_HALAR|nr:MULTISPECIES: exodeoxyribonuclease VII small subunit [Haloarcula]EMA23303.1 exonuclease VII small subunit [Haloarcula amylolytica JCM 13557]NLV11829.1 exodeoxyribonuclease VII small subunit [Haloarcula argentinensis]
MKDETIADKTDRLEQIIEQLENGDVSLERANELHAEGTELIAELESELAVGDGEVIDR